MRLTKFHGLGNDFLVAVFPDADLGPAHAVAWCDRHRGIGADGLLIATNEPGAHARMTVWNADGSRAAMSGNGIRCFAQALVRHLGGEAAGELGSDGTWVLDIETDGGRRSVTVQATDRADTVDATVSMGAISSIAPPTNWATLGCHPDRPVLHATIGNPHSVVGCDDVTAVDLGSLGAQVPEVNLEIIEPGPQVDAITMRVHERGAGITQACGTGACVSAYAARSWGLVHSDTVTVHMDGGDCRVKLDGVHATLIGPSVYIATVEVDHSAEQRGAMSASISMHESS
jgi:diaminopimelate epimerase